MALFAALSWAVTQSGRGGKNSIRKEEKFISAARITDIGASIQAGVNRMILSGINIADIDLHPDGTVTSPCTTGINCLFAPEGGGVSWPELPQYIEKGGGWTTELRLYEIADGATKSGVGNGDPLLLMTIRSIEGNVVCGDLNRGLGLPVPPPEGMFADIVAGVIIPLDGEYAGCVWTVGASGNEGTYFHVLATQ